MHEKAHSTPIDDDSFSNQLHPWIDLGCLPSKKQQVPSSSQTGKSQRKPRDNRILWANCLVDQRLGTAAPVFTELSPRRDPLSTVVPDSSGCETVGMWMVEGWRPVERSMRPERPVPKSLGTQATRAGAEAGSPHEVLALVSSRAFPLSVPKNWRRKWLVGPFKSAKSTQPMP